jgi:hypothetical protein
MKLLLPIVLGLAAAVAAPIFALADEKPRPGAAPTAVVEDQYGVTMEVEDPSFMQPSAGLMGGGKGTKLKELHVWNGAHEVLVPLGEIVRIEVQGKAENDLVPVKIGLASGAAFEGKVDRELELHGRVQFGQYQIKFDRVRIVTIRP